jgi:hypothetical protein
MSLNASLINLINKVDEIEDELVVMNATLSEQAEDIGKKQDKINTELVESHKRATREIVENPDAANGLFPEDLLVDCNAELPDFELDAETRAQLEAQFARMAQDPKIQQVKQVNDIVKYIGETGSRNGNYEHANVQTIRAWFPDATLDTIAWALECVEINPHGFVSFKHPYDVR